MIDQHGQQDPPEVPETCASRQPFVKPLVQDLGGLSELTLLGGSGGG